MQVNSLGIYSQAHQSNIISVHYFHLFHSAVHLVKNFIISPYILQTLLRSKFLSLTASSSTPKCMLHSHRCLIYFINNLQSVQQIDVLCNFRLIRFIFIIYFHIRCCIYYVCVCFHLSSVSISFFCWGLFRIYRVCVWVCLRDCRTIYPNRRTGCLCRLITRGGPQVFGLCR